MVEALWTRRLGSSPVAMRREVVDPVHGWDSELAGYQPPLRFDVELRDALAVACRPADPDVVTKELARLKVGTVGRSMDGVDTEAWLEVLGEELERFPADVVRAACRSWMRREKWMPSVAELTEECHRLSKGRFALRDALMQAQRLGRTA